MTEIVSFTLKQCDKLLKWHGSFLVKQQDFLLVIWCWTWDAKSEYASLLAFLKMSVKGLNIKSRLHLNTDTAWHQTQWRSHLLNNFKEQELRGEIKPSRQPLWHYSEAKFRSDAALASPSFLCLSSSSSSVLALNHTAVLFLTWLLLPFHWSPRPIFSICRLPWQSL